mmetsp:Transcript_41697/g.63718  ORF Transcript_41697/g.63718 Transcript_41697/m.63718 type:complete len:88 (+) Transcript_41697:691-954(+)
MASLGDMSREDARLRDLGSQIQGHSISSVDLEKQYPKSAKRPGDMMSAKPETAKRFKTSQKTSALLNKLAHPSHASRGVDSVSSSGR